MPLFRRPDGRLAKDVPHFRRIMPYIMRTRTESTVYFDQEVDLTKTLPFIEAWNAVSPRRITVFHLFTYAAVKSLHARPRLNRFVSGGRIYERNGIWMSYSTKKSLSDDAPIVAVKRRFEAEWTFQQALDVMYGDITKGRSNEKSSTDKELELIFMLPDFMVRFVAALQRWADRVNLLPSAFIKNDPFYASMFIANIGSLKLDAPFHHLYEYGNIPLFAAIGKTQKVPVVGPDNQISVKPICHIRFAFDERIEDGLYCAGSIGYAMKILEDPVGVGQIELPKALPASADAAALPAAAEKKLAV